MARKPRLEFPGAFYHVIARGNNKQKIFFDDEDYKNFLERLKLYKERFQFVLYAYVLMPNHVHMLVETGDVPLSRIMQALQFSYTQKFNRRHKKVGHLFQGRYKAILCQKEAYLLELIRYIILNPVRAHLVKRPIDWRWSSYYDLIRFEGVEHIVSVDDVLGMFGKRAGTSLKPLQKYINDGLAEGHNESYYKLKDQRILGEDGFADEIIKEQEAAASDFGYYNIDIDAVIALVARHMGIGEWHIRSITRERIAAKARGLVAYICKTLTGKTISDVSRYFGRSGVILSRMIRRVELEIEENENFRKLIKGIEMEVKENYRPCLVRGVRGKIVK